MISHHLRRAIANSVKAVPVVAATSFFEGQIFTATDFSVNKPTGTVQGDLLLVLHVTSGQAVPTLTFQSGVTWTAGANVFYRYAGASEPATYSFKGSGTPPTDDWVGDTLVVILRISGGTLGLVGSGSAAGTTTTTLPAIAPTQANTLLLAHNYSVAAGRTYTLPSGWASVHTNSNATVPSGTVMSKTVNAGTTGDIVITANSATSSNYGYLMAVYPA